MRLVIGDAGEGPGRPCEGRGGREGGEEEGERRTVEGDGGEDEADDHARGGPDHDLAAADYVDVLQREKREDEVRAGDDEAYSRWLVEADLLE